MEPKSIVDRILSETHALAFTVDDKPFPAKGRENLVHYLTGTQDPWSNKPAAKSDFLLRSGLLKIYQVFPPASTTPDHWSALVQEIQDRAAAWLVRSQDADDQTQLSFFNERTRMYESTLQIKQRVWLAFVMFNLGKRGLRFDLGGNVIAEDETFGAPIGLAPDAALETACAKRTQHFYVATYAVRRREGNGDINAYPVELVKGRGRMRWYVHMVWLDPDTYAYMNIEPEPIHRRIALVVAGEERATRPALPRDYYRDAGFQQAVIDAEDGNFDITLVLSPRYHVITLDQMVEEDHTWRDIKYNSAVVWALEARKQLWQTCMTYEAFLQIPLHQPNKYDARWEVWRHPESRYEFTFFGNSPPTGILGEILYNNVKLNIRRGYTVGSPVPPWGDIDDMLGNIELPNEIDDSLREELQETLVEATEQATEFSNTFYLPPPPTFDLPARELGQDEALEPVMVMRTRDCDVDYILSEGLVIQELVNGELVTMNILLDAPIRLSATLDIIHSMIHNNEEDVFDLSKQVLPPQLDALVRNRNLPLIEERLCPLLTFAETLGTLATLLTDEDRDRLGVWQRTFWAAEMRHHSHDRP